MFTKLTYTVLLVLCVIVALAALGGLVHFLKNFAEERQGYKQGNDWYRFVGPAILAVILAYLMKNFGMHGGMWTWVYLLLIAIGLPIALSFFLNRSSIEKKNDRMMVLGAFLLLFNAAFFTAMWTNHYRFAHAIDGENANQDEENPHLTQRNWFLIPLWILTVIVGAASGVMWRRNNTKEGDSGMNFLPFRN